MLMLLAVQAAVVALVYQILMLYPIITRIENVELIKSSSTKILTPLLNAQIVFSTGRSHQIAVIWFSGTTWSHYCLYIILKK